MRKYGILNGFFHFKSSPKKGHKIRPSFLLGPISIWLALNVSSLENYYLSLLWPKFIAEPLESRYRTLLPFMPGPVPSF